MNEVKIGNRTIPLFYSTYEMIAIQKEIGCTAFQLKDEVFGLTQEDEDDPMSVQFGCVTDPVKTAKLGTLLRILGNAGLEENGQEGDLTDKWILRNMKPPMIIGYAAMAIMTINEGNEIEKPEDEKQGPIDEGLAEENEKKPQGN